MHYLVKMNADQESDHYKKVKNVSFFKFEYCKNSIALKYHLLTY